MACLQWPSWNVASNVDLQCNLKVMNDVDKEMQVSARKAPLISKCAREMPKRNALVMHIARHIRASAGAAARGKPATVPPQWILQTSGKLLLLV